jgi:hypothetical protein
LLSLPSPKSRAMDMSMSRKAELCPGCKKPTAAQFAPFCGQGCKDRDLIKWLDEGYRLPGPQADYEDSIDRGESD